MLWRALFFSQALFSPGSCYFGLGGYVPQRGSVPLASGVAWGSAEGHSLVWVGPGKLWRGEEGADRPHHPGSAVSLPISCPTTRLPSSRASPSSLHDGEGWRGWSSQLQPSPGDVDRVGRQGNGNAAGALQLGFSIEGLSPKELEIRVG